MQSELGCSEMLQWPEGSKVPQAVMSVQIEKSFQQKSMRPELLETFHGMLHVSKDLITLHHSQNTTSS